MQTEVLDQRDEGEATCYLCRATLEEYVSNLSNTYQDFEIQREITSNVYLDRLVDTVIAKKHIPIITLVTDTNALRRVRNSLRVDDFRILDGLQRTFRLKAIRSTLDFCLRLDDHEEFANLNRYQLSRRFSKTLREINSNTEILRKLLKEKSRSGEELLTDIFSANLQWFEIWAGLTPDQQVQKMLTLNAGHKPVQLRHQLELLFLHLLPALTATDRDGFEIVREREIHGAHFSKTRQVGHFHFAHLSFASQWATSFGQIEQLRNAARAFCPGKSAIGVRTPSLSQLPSEPRDSQRGAIA
jgi:hypothetical protein